MKDLILELVKWLAVIVGSGFIGDRGWWRAMIRFTIRRWQRKNKTLK